MFTPQNVKCAQVLLTYSNLGVESQYRSSRDTFKCLFEMDVVPIVNENDPVADAYTKFGDNDTLSAMIAILVHGEVISSHGRRRSLHCKSKHRSERENHSCCEIHERSRGREYRVRAVRRGEQVEWQQN